MALRMRQTRALQGGRGAARGLLILVVMLSTMVRASDVTDAIPAPAPAPAPATTPNVAKVWSKGRGGRKPMITIRSSDPPLVLNATWVAEVGYDEADNATAIPLETIWDAKQFHRTIPAGMEESIEALWNMHVSSGESLHSNRISLASAFSLRAGTMRVRPAQFILDPLLRSPSLILSSS